MTMELAWNQSRYAFDQRRDIACFFAAYQHWRWENGLDHYIGF